MRLSAGHRSLAACVINQAVRDVRNPNGTPTDISSARMFLSGSPMLAYWCEIADLDLSCVMGRARALIAGCDQGLRDADTAEVLEDAHRGEICHSRSTGTSSRQGRRLLK